MFYLGYTSDEGNEKQKFDPLNFGSKSGRYPK
jgi:hypothetical protein